MSFGIVHVPEWECPVCRNGHVEIVSEFAPTALRERGLTDSVKIGLNGIVTLLCQGYCGSEFRAASLSWVGISHVPDPQGARGKDLIKSARVESRRRRGRRSSRGKFPERFRGRRGRPRCRGLG